MDNFRTFDIDTTLTTLGFSLLFLKYFSPHVIGFILMTIYGDCMVMLRTIAR